MRLLVKELPLGSVRGTFLSVLLLCFTLLVVSCKDDDVKPSLVNEENQYVNSWIFDEMNFWYFWNETMPSGTDKNVAPAEYFSGLLNDEDRFSWIQENYQELLNSLGGITKEAGFEYVLYRESNNSDNVVAQILYVKQNSPAHSAGLERGDLITKINGKTMTTTNYRDVIRELRENHTLVYKPLNIEDEAFGEEVSVSLSAIEFAEDPNHYTDVLDIDGRKIGYYVYTFFAPGKDNAYDHQMDEIFQQFKNSGITDLVVDLRFNSGGSEISAKNLASLIGSGVTSTSVFFKRQYNKKVNEEILKSPSLGESYLTSLYASKAANVGALLNGSRVYILTSSRTASASELIINSLKPYMEVFLIGDVTYGKNVGSISLYEENDPKNKWGLQPIVVKVANSLGTADYGNGFTPDLLNKDNSLFIYPLGDERENLLSAAIEHITGKVSSGGRQGTRTQGAEREVLRHSLDEKRRSFRLLMDETELPEFRP